MSDHPPYLQVSSPHKRTLRVSDRRHTRLVNPTTNPLQTLLRCGPTFLTRVLLSSRPLPVVRTRPFVSFISLCSTRKTRHDSLDLNRTARVPWFYLKLPPSLDSLRTSVIKCLLSLDAETESRVHLGKGGKVN